MREPRGLIEQLEQRVAERTRHLSLVHDVARAISDASSWDEGLRLALSEICAAEGWQMAYVYVVDKIHPDQLVPMAACVMGAQFEPFHLSTMAKRFRRDESLPGLVYARGTTVWIDDPAQLQDRLPARREAARRVGLKAAVGLPIRIGPETIGVWELFSDAPHPSSEELTRLMDDLGVQFSRAIERERAMHQVADLLWREQQGLLHTLHDSLGQELTGLGLLSASASQRLKSTDPSLAETLDEIKRGAARALDCLRDLSKGLFPLEVEPDALVPALRQLAATTEGVSKIRCRVEAQMSVRPSDARIAAELFRIAQEAVTNAVKHANPHEIVIRLQADTGAMALTITDDGVGMPEGAPRGDGMGLRIMQYRAKSIGANLSIGRGVEAGTVVTCTLRETPKAGGERRRR